MASLAKARWPKWIGLKDPPKTASLFFFSVLISSLLLLRFKSSLQL